MNIMPTSPVGLSSPMMLSPHNQMSSQRKSIIANRSRRESTVQYATENAPKIYSKGMAGKNRRHLAGGFK